MLFQIPMSKRLTAALFSAVIFAGGEVLALPFQPNPESFAAYMSSLKWKNGAMKTKFTYLSRCNVGFLGSYRDPKPDGYYCMGGYVKWSDPTGSSTCEIKYVGYRSDKGSEWEC